MLDKQTICADCGCTVKLKNSFTLDNTVELCGMCALNHPRCFNCDEYFTSIRYPNKKNFYRRSYRSIWCDKCIGKENIC